MAAFRLHDSDLCGMDLMGLSEDVMEAASIDGASGWVKLKNIIIR